MLINFLGLLLIAFIIWWFWLYKPSSTQAVASEELVIKVQDGTYQPSNITIAANKATKLTFLRTDASPCAATVMFADLDISEELPLNKTKTVFLPPLSPGEYPFSCQMQMYKGVLIVKELSS
jgi:plastocyanin domain-containing protein